VKDVRKSSGVTKQSKESIYEDFTDMYSMAINKNLTKILIYQNAKYINV